MKRQNGNLRVCLVCLEHLFLRHGQVDQLLPLLLFHRAHLFIGMGIIWIDKIILFFFKVIDVPGAPGGPEVDEKRDFFGWKILDCSFFELFHYILESI